MTYLYKFEYQHLMQVKELNLIDEDYKKRAFILFDHYNELEKSYKTGVVSLLSVSGWYEAIDRLLDLSERTINNSDWNREIEKPTIDHHLLIDIGRCLKKIGFPEDKLEYYSIRIHKNIIEKSNYSWRTITFLSALALQKDERTHHLLKKFLKNHTNFLTDVFEAIVNYKDENDLELIEPYMSGTHVQKGDPMGTNSELHSTAKKAYNKLSKLVQKKNN